ncbi:MAG: transglycosylase SLT domain-containing protein [Pseudomonadota bacterium]
MQISAVPSLIVSHFIIFLIVFCHNDLALANLNGSEASASHPSLPLINIEEQRELFLSAEKALRKKKLTRFKELKRQLSQYPLEMYLDYAFLKRYISQASSEDVEHFFERTINSPLERRFRAKWLKHLIKTEQNADFIRFYKPGINTSLTCHYLTLRTRQGERLEQLDAVINNLWQTGKSLPPACDTILQAWRDENFISEHRAWNRIHLAIERKNYALAKYLKRYLLKNERYLVDWAIELRRYPQGALKKLTQTPRSEKESEIFSESIRRLAWIDRDKAILAWQKLQDSRSLSPAQAYNVSETIAVSLAVDNHDAAPQWLQSVPHNASSPKLNEWRLRHALRHRDWEQVQEWVTQLNFADTEFGITGQRYWFARMLSIQGFESRSQDIFKELANERSYYGFLSSALIQKSPNLRHQPMRVPLALIAQVAQNDTIKRAKELFHLGRTTQARREWAGLYQQFNRDELKAAAIVASEWQWYDRSIFTAAAIKHFNDIELRFPLAYKNTLQKYAAQHKIDLSWAFAITRQESAFMSDVRSHAGATGLMQLMPYTAKSLAKKMRIRYRGKHELTRPEKNVKFGTFYLQQLSNRYQGNPILATASYNAGPHRVIQWIPKNDSLSMDVWIENIPYNETRNYVKNVVAYEAIYSQKLGQRPSLIKRVITETVGKDTGSDKYVSRSQAD